MQTTIKNATRILLLAALAVFCLAASAAQAPSASPNRVQNRLTITGAATLAPLVNDIARRFEQRHPGIRIEVRSVGSGKGLTDLRAGTTDIAMLSRALLNSERDLFAFPIARDGVAVIVHRDNPVKNIDTQQLAELLTSKLVNWKALGGRDAPIAFAWRRGHGSVELVLTRLGVKREQLGGHLLGDDDDAIQFASASPNGVTLTSVGQAERSVQAGAPIKLLAYNGAPASSRTIRSHGYMLSRPLTLITRHLPEGLQKQFIDYALSSNVIDLQLKYGFVPYQE